MMEASMAYGPPQQTLHAHRMRGSDIKLAGAMWSSMPPIGSSLYHAPRGLACHEFIPSTSGQASYRTAARWCGILSASSLKHRTWPCSSLSPDKQEVCVSSSRESNPHFSFIGKLLTHSLSKSKQWACHASLDAVDPTYNSLDVQSHKGNGSSSISEIPTEQPDTISNTSAELDLNQNLESYGRSGVVSFYSGGQHESSPPLTSPPLPVQEVQPTNDAWVSVLWVLGPAVLVSSVVLPPFFLRRIFEVVLEDSLITDFLILFFTETLFYAGVFAFLVVAHKVQQSTGVHTWRSGSRSSLGYRLSTYITMGLAVLLPLGAFAMVWPWTGPAAAAALLPYIAGLAVQYAFEQVVHEKKWSVWPVIPVIFQVYRLHQLNRATQLVAGLLYSLRGAEATAETLAVNGSLQTLVTVLQLLGMLCLWALTSYLIHAFSSESQEWQGRAVS